MCCRVNHPGDPAIRDPARLRSIIEKLGNRAHQRAMHELRDLHRAEFEHLLQKHRHAVGLNDDGTVDMDVALAAFEDRRPRRRVLRETA